jgi:hypothetical protein
MRRVALVARRLMMPAMRTATIALCLLLAACLERPDDPSPAPTDHVGQPSDPGEPVSVDDEEHRRYCAERGTFCAPLGASCDRDYSPICGEGLNWCDPGGVCREFCAEGFDRCPGGATVHEPRGDGSATCYCVR